MRSTSAVREMLCCSHTMTNSFSDSRSNRIFSSRLRYVSVSRRRVPLEWRSHPRDAGGQGARRAVAKARRSDKGEARKRDVLRDFREDDANRKARAQLPPVVHQIGDEQRPLLQANEANAIGKLRLEAVPVGAVEVDPGFQNPLAARRPANPDQRSSIADRPAIPAHADGRRRCRSAGKRPTDAQAPRISRSAELSMGKRLAVAGEMRGRSIAVHEWLPSAAGVDDGPRAGRGLDIGDDFAIRRLPRSALAAQLADRLDVQRPSLHVGVGEMASVGVGRQRAVDSKRSALDEPPSLSARTEAEPFETEQDRRAEVVVGHERIDVAMGDARHPESLLPRFANLVVPEVHVEILDRRLAKGVPSAKAADKHGRLAQILSPARAWS